MWLGVINNDSDLYVLVVIVLVLLIGKEFFLLMDVYNLIFNWCIEISISENLGNVLDKMLVFKLSDCFFIVC